MTASDARRRGRQREAAHNDQAILDAARRVFSRSGWDAPVSAIAQAAGVGMGSLYRRYPSKTALLQRLCVLSLRQSAEAAEQALAEADPWQALAGYVRSCVGFGAGAFSPLAGTLPVTTEMRHTARRADTLLHALVDRAHQAGALREDVTAADITWLVRQFGQHLLATTENEIEAVMSARLLAITLDGVRTRGGEALPGPAPSTHALATRWHATAT